MLVGRLRGALPSSGTCRSISCTVDVKACNGLLGSGIDTVVLGGLNPAVCVGDSSSSPSESESNVRSIIEVCLSLRMLAAVRKCSMFECDTGGS
jgi:hypothetical protein